MPKLIVTKWIKKQKSNVVDETKKVVWITGASSGIGQALALEYVRQGAAVILSARRESVLNGVKKECVDAGALEQNVLVLPLDVTQEETLESSTEKAFAFKGQIDLLINNAGISQRSSCLNTTMPTYRTLFDVDVFGQIALTKCVLPLMIKQGFGHIAVTSSVAGKIGVPYRTGYCAAKHAVMGFFDALRSEVAHQNISVSTITPGFIRTNVSKNALAGDGSAFGQVDENISGGMAAGDCAKVVVAGLNKGKKEIAVGKGSEMHALWIKRFFPNLLTKILEKQYKKRAAKGTYK